LSLEEKYLKTYPEENALISKAAADPVSSVSNAIDSVARLAMKIIDRSHTIPQKKKDEFKELYFEYLNAKNQMKKEARAGENPYGDVILELAEHAIKKKNEFAKYSDIWAKELDAEPPNEN